MTKVTATITSKANVEVESPFICTMGIIMNGEQRTAAMIGNQARALFKDLKPKNVVELIGHDCPHKRYLNKDNLFMVDSITFK